MSDKTRYAVYAPDDPHHRAFLFDSEAAARSYRDQPWMRRDLVLERHDPDGTTTRLGSAVDERDAG